MVSSILALSIQEVREISVPSVLPKCLFGFPKPAIPCDTFLQIKVEVEGSPL